MKYIINSNIEFDSAEYTLRLINRPNSLIKISGPAGRILEELIKHQNEEYPVTREHLFMTVWKDHGLEPSNGNLNQQISLIRKTLATFGLPASSIITIPKRGLKLNSQLTIKNIQNNSSISNIPSNQTKNKNNIPLSDSIIFSFKTYIRYTITLIIMIAITFSIGSIYLYHKTNNIKLYCCKEINSCNICAFPETPKLENNDYNIPKSEIT